MTFQFSAKLWEYEGKGAWHFVTVPKPIAQEIKEISSSDRRGFGSVRVKVVIGKSNWDTTIFPDSTNGTYLLPIKKEIRETENISDGDQALVAISLIGY